MKKLKFLLKVFKYWISYIAYDKLSDYVCNEKDEGCFKCCCFSHDGCGLAMVASQLERIGDNLIVEVKDCFKKGKK